MTFSRGHDSACAFCEGTRWTTVKSVFTQPTKNHFLNKKGTDTMNIFGVHSDEDWMRLLTIMS